MINYGNPTRSKHGKPQQPYEKPLVPLSHFLFSGICNFSSPGPMHDPVYYVLVYQLIMRERMMVKNMLIVT